MRAFATIAAAVVVVGLGASAAAADAPVMVVAEDEVAAATLRLIEQRVADRRPLRSPLPWPNGGVELEEQARRERSEHVAEALRAARELEGEARFDECVERAAGATGEAVEVLAETDDLRLLRALHLQLGFCLTLAERPADAEPHWLTALLVDESPPPRGLHRGDAEDALLAVREQVLARSRGAVRIASEPDGAQLWIDGRRAKQATPTKVDGVRLGDHFVTLRRFRFEPYSARVVLQPSGALTVALEPASRATLRRQLAFPPAGLSDHERRLASARWSRADELLIVAGAGLGDGVRLELFDAATGASVRSTVLGDSEDDEAVTQAVCRVLGESCDVEEGGIPWYVWPLAGATVIAASISIGFAIDAARDARFCPPSGC